MKKPKLFTTLAAKINAASKRRYQATARAARAQQIDDYDDDQPTTKLSSAFIVVLILHVVAVGGIYAFNSIKASRRGLEQTQMASSASGTTAAETQKTAAENESAPAAPTAPPAAAAHSADAVVATGPAVASSIAKASGLKEHVVKANENATKIAFAYRVTAAELLAANGLKENAVLHIGQVLAIPEPKTDVKAQADAHKASTPAKDIPATRTTPGQYVVKKKDTVVSIAKAVGASVEELIKLNKIADPKKLQLGQVLKVPPRKS